MESLYAQGRMSYIETRLYEKEFVELKLYGIAEIGRNKAMVRTSLGNPSRVARSDSYHNNLPGNKNEKDKG